MVDQDEAYYFDKAGNLIQVDLDPTNSLQSKLDEILDEIQDFDWSDYDDDQTEEKSLLQQTEPIDNGNSTAANSTSTNSTVTDEKDHKDHQD